jgi:initiation factor 1A
MKLNNFYLFFLQLIKMVKNLTGGNKSKGQARKFTTAKPSSSLRLSENDCELYAQVTKVLGGGMCNVICIDDTSRLCFIRGKFKTRGKRDNFINNGTWVLIGLRDWVSSGKDKLEQCDLLEVYNDHEKDKLKSTVTNINWSVFVSNDIKFYSSSTSKDKDDDDHIVFADEKEQEYMEIISKQIEAKTSNKSKSVFFEEEEEINFDDI